jgi:hypothetical protein
VYLIDYREKLLMQTTVQQNYSSLNSFVNHKFLYNKWTKHELLSIATCPHKARLAEPEEMDIAREQLSKHASVVIDTHATIEELLEMMFLCSPCRGCVLGTEPQPVKI